jgi:periplasmic protein TonB
MWRWLGSPFFFSTVLHAGLLLTVLPLGEATRIGSYEVDLINAPAPAVQNLKASSQVAKPDLVRLIKNNVVAQNDNVNSVQPTVPDNSSGASLSAQSSARMQGDLDIYAMALRREIDLRKTYPQMARARREQGKVEVRFTVLKDGLLQNIQLYKPNSSADLNEAALTAVNGVKQFRPLPESFTKTEWDLVISIDFVLGQK